MVICREHEDGATGLETSKKCICKCYERWPPKLLVVVI